MTEDKIRIVATDGNDTVTLGYISCGKQYVFGQVTSDGTDDPFHYTYHRNGYLHLKWAPDTPDAREEPMYYGPPLENFRGFVSMETASINDEVGKIVSPDFGDDERGYENITYIDVQNSEYGMLYQPFICEPGFCVGKRIEDAKLDIPNGLESPLRLSYQIYTEVQPWVGVAYWQQPDPIHDLGATSNFRPMGTAVRHKAHIDPYPEPCPNGESGCEGPDGTGPLCMECYEGLDS